MRNNNNDSTVRNSTLFFIDYQLHDINEIDENKEAEASLIIDTLLKPRGPLFRAVAFRDPEERYRRTVLAPMANRFLSRSRRPLKP